MEPYWVSLELRKGGDARFLSHLDLLGALERALRRSPLRPHWRGGFNPRPRLSAGDALPLGALSEGEWFGVALEGPIDPAEVYEHLAPQLRGGLALVSVRAGKPAAPRAPWAWRLVFAAPLPSEAELLRRLAAAGPLRDDRGRLREPGALSVQGASLRVEAAPGAPAPPRPELLVRALGLEEPLQTIKLAPRRGAAEKLEKEIDVTHSIDQRVGPGGAPDRRGGERCAPGDPYRQPEP